MVKRVISVAMGLRSQTIAFFPFLSASVAVIPLPTNGSRTIPPSGQYVFINSPTTFHVFLAQNLCHMYIGVWASGGI